MVAEDRYCVDVLLQIAAVRAALEAAGKVLLAAHVESCVADAVASGRPRERKQKLDELLGVLARFGAVGAS
jgi:DNA-binding FrmR family transcriptional regulator